MTAEATLLEKWIDRTHHTVIGHPHRKTAYLFKPTFSLAHLTQAQAYARSRLHAAQNHLEEAYQIRERFHRDEIPETRFYRPETLRLYSADEPEERECEVGRVPDGEPAGETGRRALERERERRMCARMIAWYCAMRDAVGQVDAELRRAIAGEQARGVAREEQG